MSVKKMRIFLIIAAAAIISVSCGNYVVYPGGGDEVEEIFTNFEEQTDGTFLFYTNMEKYLGINGSTFWKIGTVYALATADYEYSVIIQKRTGDSYGGAGIVFAAGDSENFLVLLVNNEREYLIAKKVEGVSFSILSAWKYSEYLYGGSSQNTIDLMYDTETATFRIYFNSDAAGIVFQDTTTSPFAAGYMGYAAELKADEDFPLVPVDITFDQVIPATIGMN